MNYSRFFNHEDDTGTLGAMIAGSTGVFWSLSSVALFAASLLQTRIEIKMQRIDFKKQTNIINKQKDEIKQQRELQELQQNESTFNFLLSNYDRNINGVEYYGYNNEKLFGLEALNQLERVILSDFNEYAEMFHKEFTHNINVLTYQYDIYFNRAKDKLKLVDLVFNNFIFLFDFTTTKFTNPSFYQNLLWNKYSNAEKFIVGMVLTNQYPINLKYSDTFYEYYKSQTNYQKHDYQLPIVYLNKSVNWQEKGLFALNTSLEELKNNPAVSNYLRVLLENKFCYNLSFVPDYFEGFIGVQFCHVNYNIILGDGSELELKHVNLKNPFKLNEKEFSDYCIDLNYLLHDLAIYLFKKIDFRNDLYKPHTLNARFSLFYSIKSNIKNIKSVKLTHKGQINITYFNDRLDVTFS